MISGNMLRITYRNLHTTCKTMNSNLPWKPPDSLVMYKDFSKKYIKSRLTDVVNYCQEVTGIRQLTEMQYRVLIATDMLKAAHDQRRDSKIPLMDVQKKLQDIQHEIRNTTRDDDRYLILMRDEHALIKESKFYQERLQEAEKEERECFEQLGAALRSSHEAERIQSEKNKYISMIWTLIGAIITGIATTINNHYRTKKLEKMVIDSNNPGNFQLITEKLNYIEEKLLNCENKDVVVANVDGDQTYWLWFIGGYIVSKLF